MAACFVNADVVRSWEKTGKTEFTKTCRKLIESNSTWSLGSKSLKTAMYEICWQVMKGNLKTEQAISAIGDVMNLQKDIPSLMADVLSIIDLETSTNEDKMQRDRFISVAAACVMFIPEPVLKERLDHDTLENISLIQSKVQFTQKYVKVKTKLYYKQQKFNLMREESEGYAKVITELNQEITDDITPTSTLQTIKSLIGCFDLDPNRVLDVMLESFECRSTLHSYFVPLIKSYMAEQGTICHILGFKFHFYQDPADETTPQSLYRVAALLLKHKLVQLEDLYPHLSPADSAIAEQHKKQLMEAKQYARSKSIVSLADKTEDKEKDIDNKIDLFESNQKLGLIKALIEVEDWPNAKCIMDRMPPFFASSHKAVSAALCSLIHAIMEPLYRKHTGLPSSVSRKRMRDGSQQPLAVGSINSYQGLHRQVFPMLSYLGPSLHNDVLLIAKIIRLGKAFMNMRRDGGISPEDDLAYYGFLTMLDEVILPSLTLLPCNCSISEELWSLLKLYPYELRYRLYGRWKNETCNVHPALIRAKADCLDRAKYIMKRLAKENVKPSGRQLGKLSHSSPGTVFEYVLSQIQRYDNFIGPVVDSMKFLTSLSYDMLTYCIIEAVANPEKERLKHDDTNISLWLQSLANFAGSICKKYQIELTGMLQYVANQLKAGKSFDLLLLREILQKMAGIEISEEITDDQLEAMSGGELLKQEGGYFSQVRNTKKSSTRLKDVLLENDLALSLCMLMAQQRDGVIYREGEERHLKLVGKLYDQCQDTLVQFGSFLSMQLSTEEFVKRLPSIDILVSTFNVPPDAAFFLSRSLYTHGIATKFDELKKIDKSNKQTSSQQKLQRYLEAVESVMSPVVELVRPLHTPKVWDDLSPQFYVTFWSLSMYDLCPPSTMYEKQLQQLKSQIDAIEDNRELPQGKKKKEKERCTSLKDKLQEEEKRQNDHVGRVMARLKHEKDTWFLSRSTKNETITQFLQLCIFPRCCFTASDAVYCAKYIQILHDLKTTNFSTLICYDRIFCDITYSVTSCTENEAHRYGRFLCAAMDTIMRWHSDQALYDKECASYPGFVTVFRKGAEDSNNKADQLDYENYRHVCHKWHFRITKAMVTCLESGNYIQIRNALIILTKILPHYPKILQFGQAVERRVDRLRQEEKEKRPDIYALAMGYSGQLKAKKSSWVPENEFHLKEKDQKNQAKAANAKADASKTPAVKEAAAKCPEANGHAAESNNKEKKDGKAPSSVEVRKSTSETDSRHSKGDREKTHTKISKSKTDVQADERGKHGRDDDERVRTVRVKEEGRVKVKEEKVLRLKEESKELDRASSVASSGSHGSQRRSAEPSPHTTEDREPKRRKIEAPVSGSKEKVGASDHEKHKRSPSNDRDRDKKERKRDHNRSSLENNGKKHYHEERTVTASGSSSKQNGLSDREVLQSSSKSRLREESGPSRDYDKSKRESRELYSETRRVSTDKDHSAHWDVDEWLASPGEVEGSRSESERVRDDSNRSSPRERLSSKDLISPKLKRDREVVEDSARSREEKKKIKKEKGERDRSVKDKVRSTKKIRK
ncbi:THO complex subunit 2-like isoform X2 [Liolophura sinensis]|uniref:THO complex subunit 2-like isoform X2 n=1 Tax=Liolophura sinensis TaxID=3198878 RepID=UPI003159575B